LGDIQQTNRWVKKRHMAFPHVGDKSAQTLDKLTPPTQKQSNKQTNWIINQKLKRNMQQRRQSSLRTREKGVSARSWPRCERSVNKDWKGRWADSRQVMSCCLK
jgi:hypothetical protein